MEAILTALGMIYGSVIALTPVFCVAVYIALCYHSKELNELKK